MTSTEPRGLGGWLILVAIGLIVTPLRLVYLLVGTYTPIFANGKWAALTSESGAAYHPLWRPVLLLEIIGNAALAIAAVIGLVLFFRRSVLFPRFMIGFYVFGALFLMTDFVLSRRIPAVASSGDPSGGRDLARSIVTCAIWVPYMLKSRRVHKTFREGGVTDEAAGHVAT